MKVGTFRRDARAMREGEWVSPGPEFEDVEIKTRAMLPVYHDQYAIRVAREARRVGGEANIGIEFRNRLVVDLIIAHCILDIRGLEHDDHTPILFEEFCEMIRDESYADLAAMAIKATGAVGRARDDVREDAIKNSVVASTDSYVEEKT